MAEGITWISISIKICDVLDSVFKGVVCTKVKGIHILLPDYTFSKISLIFIEYGSEIEL